MLINNVMCQLLEWEEGGKSANFINVWVAKYNLDAKELPRSFITLLDNLTAN